VLLFKRIKKNIHDFKNNNNGATAIEYGLIVALIFLAILGSVNAFADQVVSMYNMIASEVTNASKTG
jgi:pilus assembly protein Flp/PilA